MAKRAQDPTALREAIRSSGFTPGARDVGALLELLAEADERVVEDAELALARLGPSLVARTVERAASAGPPLRGRLCRLVGKLGGDEALAFLLAALADDDAKARRNAVIALGKMRSDDGGPAPRADEIERALLDAWERETRPDHRRSIAASLGKVGGPRALETLRAAKVDADPELAKIVERATLMLARTESRAEPGRIDATKAPVTPARVLLSCRGGLEALVLAELGPSWAPRTIARGKVEAKLSTPLASLFTSRTMLTFGFPLAPVPVTRQGGSGEGPGRHSDADVGEAVTQAVASEEARAIFETWTVGAVRYRIAWGEGGHRRALVWRCAREIARRRPAWINDPTSSTWEVVVHEPGADADGRRVEVELRPRALADPRFTYRRGDVPAASHPTIAAALARVAGVRDDDVVWDPFVGSGSELVERAIAGPYAALYGSDVDPRAIAVARANLEAAGVRDAHVAVGDARHDAPEGVTLIVTNPPMGRRVLRRPALDALLESFLRHAAGALGPSGRLVWITPLALQTTAIARALGFLVEYAEDVDMGGFLAQMQRLRRPGG